MLETIKEKWSEILDYLKREHDITDVSLNTWLLPLKVADIRDNTLYILNPDDSQSLRIKYIKKKYYIPLKVAIAEVTGFNLEIEFVLSDNFNNQPSIQESEPQQNIFEKAGLNSKYTFENFVVGENNNLAHAAALAVAESPAEMYNPLYIYGGVGLGKTHLMQAIAHFILKNDPSKKVLYTTSETFTNEIIDAIRNEGSQGNIRFREKYRNVDVLLIDDIHFISGKETTQQEFFHTFNTLYDNKKQIIISSDKLPKEIDNLEERLSSRFLWGLPVDIQSPNYETRVAILKKKLEQEGMHNFPNDVVDYISSNVSSNIRELEGALKKIVAYSKLTSSEINLEFARTVLHDLFDKSQREITPEIIIKIVAEHFGITVSDISSKKKNAEIVYPRQLAMYLCRSLTDAALSLIGKNLGGRDHTTVIHGFDKIQKEIDSNEKIRKDVDILKRKIIPY